MDKYQLPDEIETQINKRPRDNRRASTAELRHGGRARVTYWIQPRLQAWIHTHILDVSGWTWRQFTEAAVAAVFSPHWVHPTWHANYDARGVGNRPLDTSKMVGWTPFLDEIPAARALVRGIEPHVRSDHERMPLPEQQALSPFRSQVRYTASDADGSGAVAFDWFGHTHAFLAECGALTPVRDTDPRQSRYKRRERALSASEIARQCVTAHFEPNGIPALREASFRVWREYALLKSGMQDHASTVHGVYERMRNHGQLKHDAPRVSLWSADQGEHVVMPVQYECGLWPESVIRRFWRS